MLILRMSASSSVLIAAVLLLRLIFGKYLPRRTFTALWTIAALRMLIPFYAMPMTENAALYDAMPPFVQRISVGYPEKAESDGNKNILPIAEAVYSAGVLLTGAFFLIPHMRFMRDVSSALPAEDDHHEMIMPFNIRRKVCVKISDRIISPVTVGVIRPVILLPKCMDYDKKTMDFILAHELVHIKRFDVLMKYLSAAAVCVHWFNPLAWIMFRMNCRDIELACDEEVLKITGGDPAEYAMALISAEENKAALTAGFGSSEIKERIGAIMNFKNKSVICIAAAAVLVAASMTVFVSADFFRSDASADTAETSDVQEDKTAYIAKKIFVGTSQYLTEAALNNEKPASPLTFDAINKDYFADISEYLGKISVMIDADTENYLVKGVSVTMDGETRSYPGAAADTEDETAAAEVTFANTDENDSASVVMNSEAADETSNADVTFVYPVENRSVSADYQSRNEDSENFHHGIDFAWNGCEGSDISAAADGIVSDSAYNSNYGNYVVVDHGNGYSTIYAHLSEISVSIGDSVKTGEKIGLLGSTGAATGANLHFEVHEDGIAQDPQLYLFYPF